MKNKILRLTFVILIIGSVSLFVGWLNKVDRTDLFNNEGRTFERAVVTDILKDNLTENNNRVGNQKVTVKILSGKFKGQECQALSSSSFLYGAECKEGLHVIVIISEYAGSISASVYNYDRGLILYLIIAFFFVVLWFCGGKKGLLSALGLILTFLCIIKIFLPLIYRGCSPVTAAVIVVILSTFCSIYLLNGFSEKSICAISGTVCGVLIAAFFSFIFCKISHISGMNVSDIESLVYISQVTDIQTGKLLFAGILISSLGAVMDVAVSLSSTMFEIKQQNKAISSRELFKSGMNVGRDMMGTMSNTLILAFAGGSINTLVFIYSYKYSYFQTLNMYSIGIELIQGIAATLGVVLTVPLTCAICTFVYERNK